MNNRFIIYSILTILLGCAQPILAQPIIVCKDCKTSSLKQAIALAKDYDTIIVKKGTYKEYNIEINKPLTIIGENYPVIDGELKGKVKRSKMPAADIQSVLGLTKRPDFRTKIDRTYFCSFKSESWRK